METIKSLAEELGKSKTAISNKIKELGLDDKLTRQGNKWLIPDDKADLIRQGFTGIKSDTKTDTVNADVLAVLKAQLEAKDKQIEELQRTNAELIKTLQQNNHLLLLAQGAPDPEHESPEESEQTQGEDIPKKGFFSRIFGR